jgi:anti-sigma regulatory factor (Ser/Thr protein kinase)
MAPRDYMRAELKDISKIPKKASKEIQSFVGSITNNSSDTDLRGTLFELILNAYQHAHNSDGSKPICVAYKVEEGVGTYVVFDRSRMMSIDYIRFLKHVREEGCDSTYYEFTGKTPLGSNEGCGTVFIHSCCDSVEYHKAENGLAVKIGKKIF